MSFIFLQNTNFRQPLRELTRDEIDGMDLKYYNPEIHQAAFILPEFARKVNAANLLELSDASAREHQSRKLHLYQRSKKKKKTC